MTKIKSISQLTLEALDGDSNDSEQIAGFVAVLRENRVKCGSQATQSIFISGAFFIGWILAYTANISKLSVLGIDLNNMDILLLILAPLSAFSLYRYQVSMTLSDLIDSCLRELYKSHFKSFDEKGLTELLSLPSFFTIENSLANLESDKGFVRKFADIWVLVIGLLMSFGPIIALLWSSYIIISKQVINLSLSIISVALIMLFLIRTIFVFIQWMRQL